MQPLTNQGSQTINDLSRRYGVSTDAAMTLLQALVNGNGSMAQFNHGELGGGGQWMRGGMTMVGDMFNNGLKAKVDGLCNELSQILAQQPFETQPAGSRPQWQGGPPQGGDGVGSGSWWPAGLGSPNSSGGQNNVRYAYFAGPRRLALEVNGRVTVYDTLDNQIGGVSQQQGSDGSLTFTSQYGTVNLASLPVVSG